MKAKLDGVEIECISADVEKGEIMLALLAADGNPVLQPNGEPDTVTRRGVVELMLEITKNKWADSE